MGSCSSLVGPKPVRVIMVGLDSSGKTTLLYMLRLGEYVNTIPTIGFNVETLPPLGNLSITMWDVGGQDKIRALWRHYYPGCNAMFWVVDSTDEERMVLSAEQLQNVLSVVDMKHVPVIVLANKQDLASALSPDIVRHKMKLDDGTIIDESHPWEIHGISAANGDGLADAMQALSRVIKTSKLI